MSPKNTEAVAEKPAFDVSQTDKRSDKRVIIDYVFASKFAPEKVSLFAPFQSNIDAVLATEGLQEIHTPVDTLIAQLSTKLDERYVDGDYSDYQMRGNGASFWTEKAKRATKSPTDKASDFLEKADPEQLAALAELLKARGIEL